MGVAEWGNRRREKSIIVRGAKSLERAEEIRAYKRDHPKATTREIGSLFNVTLIERYAAIKKGGVKHTLTMEEIEVLAK